VASLILLHTPRNLPSSIKASWTPLKQLRWEAVQVHRRMVETMKKKLAEQERLLAIRERRFANELECKEVACGECSACERNAARQEFSRWDTVEGMIPTFTEREVRS